MEKTYIAFFVLALIVITIDVVCIFKHSKLEDKIKRIEEILLHSLAIINNKLGVNSEPKQEVPKTEDKKA
jgi:hypothetical protein